jgi:hypothetical protein
MDLDQQMQALIDGAPQDGSTPQVMRAIAPAITSLASQLQHLQYFILQAADQSWVMTTLSHRVQPDLQKKVIYAFPTRQDAASSPYAPKDSHVNAVPVPVTHILFQMVVMKAIDSTVFFETAGDLANGTEVSRQNLQHLIQLYLQNYRQQSAPPPDIA